MYPQMSTWQVSEVCDVVPLQGPGNQRRSGHVLRVNGTARTAVVCWDPSSSAGETLPEEEEVSCYALRVRPLDLSSVFGCKFVGS